MGCLEPVTYGTKARLGIVNGVNYFIGLKTLCVLLLKLGEPVGTQIALRGSTSHKQFRDPSFHCGCYIGQAFNTIRI